MDPEGVYAALSMMIAVFGILLGFSYIVVEAFQREWSRLSGVLKVVSKGDKSTELSKLLEGARRGFPIVWIFILAIPAIYVVVLLGEMVYLSADELSSAMGTIFFSFVFGFSIHIGCLFLIFQMGWRIRALLEETL